ncbi:MAG: TonB-dependent receptor plug domain-containing protein, partial [Bacteroidota bacterium]
MSHITIFSALLLTFLNPAEDSLEIRMKGQLSEVEITGYEASRLRTPEVVDGIILAGKQSAIIDISATDANLVQNLSRQVYSRTPGVFIWESDGSGVQTGISVRGLNPNRSWEFNVRQNGYDIAADPFGYPEAYYSPPLEAVESIRIISGSASLQFGPQFGGLLDYCMKSGDSTKKI